MLTISELLTLNFFSLYVRSVVVMAPCPNLLSAYGLIIHPSILVNLPHRHLGSKRDTCDVLSVSPIHRGHHYI